MTSNKTIFGRAANSILSAMSRRRLPQIEGTLRLDGINEQVEILRDRWGVPHIYAQNQRDMFFAQGFAHAQDRLFQMELNRRTARGRLSELFGELSLDTDRTVRTFGFERLGRIDIDNTTDEMREIMESYARGVNAYLDHPGTRLPIEFTLLNHKPEPWEILDSMAFSRIMIWQLSHDWQSEIIRAEIAEKVGVEQAAELEINYLKSNPVTLPKGLEFNRLDPDGSLTKVRGPFLQRGKGSNGWVVSPDRSETGHAVLCNDMHLNMSLPSLWYEVHMNAPGYHTSGVSLPGLPMVMVGHNERISWGMTLAFTDAEDLFVEQFENSDPPCYHFRGELRDADVLEEKIRVKGSRDPYIEKVIITHHGPIISDVVGYPQKRIAVQSMALVPTPALEGWYRLNTAAGWDDFIQAVKLIEAPQLNTIYADVEDNIGYWVTGKVPIRMKGDGRIPAPGWSGEYEWKGYVPFEEMPHALNPEEGILITCNNKIEADDYPYFLGGDYMNGFRSRRLSELIEEQKVLSEENHREFQMDLSCIPGQELVKKLADYESDDPELNILLEQLRTWDGKLTEETIGGSVYKVLRHFMVQNLLKSALEEDFVERVMGVGFHPILAGGNEFYGQDTVTLLRLIDNPDSWWVQKSGGRKALITKSLKQSSEWLQENAGKDPSDWKWGHLNKIGFEHPMSLQKPFDQVFDRGPYPIGGDTDTLSQIAKHGIDPDLNRVVGASFRQIIDMSDLTKSVAIHAPGQSGRLGSPYYDNLIQMWLDGEYHPVLWTRSQVEGEVDQQLILKPEENQGD